MPAPFFSVGKKSVTNTPSSATDGPLCPQRIGVRHAIFSPAPGNLSTMPVSFQTPPRPFPRHSGQSSARSDDMMVASEIEKTMQARRRRWNIRRN